MMIISLEFPCVKSLALIQIGFVVSSFNQR